MTATDRAQLAQEVVGRDHVAALALDRLYEDRRYLFGWKRGLEELLLNEARAAQRPRFLFLRSAGGAAIHIRILNMCDAANQGREPPLLLRLRSGERQGSHGAPVEGAKEGNNVLAPGVV